MNIVNIPAELAEEIWADLRGRYDRAEFPRDFRWRPMVKPGDKVIVLVRDPALKFTRETGLVARIPTEDDLGILKPGDWLDVYLRARAWAIVGGGKPGDRALVIDAAAKYPHGKVGTLWVADDLRVSLLPSDGTAARWPIREWAVLPAPLPVVPSEAPESDSDPVEPVMSVPSQIASTAEERRAEAAANPDVWRVGGSPGTHGRNIYRGTECVAMAFKSADAERIVDAMNAAAEGARTSECVARAIARLTAELAGTRDRLDALRDLVERPGLGES